MCVFVVSALCVFMKQRAGRERRSTESDGEDNYRSLSGVSVTEGRKKKRRGRQEEQQMKREMGKGQVFERRRKCVR